MPDTLTPTLVRLGIDVLCVAVLVRLVYFRYYRRSDLFLTFFALNLAVFLIARLLSAVEMTMGAAFGLFAVFSMLRYRTEGITARDMTYLFLVIALGLLLAIAPGGATVALIVGVALIAVTWALEAGLFASRELSAVVMYDNVALVHTGSRPALIEDLQKRLGLAVHRVDVQQVDFVRDSALLTVYYEGD